MTEREIQDLLREMRDEPVPADSLARVRLAVEKRTGKRSGWKWVVPLALAASVVAGFLLLRPTKTPLPVERPGMPVTAEVIPTLERPIQAVQIPPRPKRIRSRRQLAEVVPVSIRIETPDPDVVILFVN